MAVHIDLTGRTAVVTGATRGIGAAIAATLEQAGATVIRTATKSAGAGASGRHLAVDFSDEGSTRAFLDELRASRIDILINNAGVNRIQQIAEAHQSDYDWMSAINLRAPFLCAQAVAPGMMQRGWGRIVNISSIWGSITKPGRSFYTMTKHGLVGLTKTLAVELAASGVLVNAVSPGFTRTELTDSTLAPADQAVIAAQVPARRFAEPSEMAQVVLFLSSELNTYLTGQNVTVDGGFTIV